MANLINYKRLDDRKVAVTHAIQIKYLSEELEAKVKLMAQESGLSFREYAIQVALNAPIYDEISALEISTKHVENEQKKKIECVADAPYSDRSISHVPPDVYAEIACKAIKSHLTIREYLIQALTDGVPVQKTFEDVAPQGEKTALSPGQAKPGRGRKAKLSGGVPEDARCPRVLLPVKASSGKRGERGRPKRAKDASQPKAAPSEAFPEKSLPETAPEPEASPFESLMETPQEEVIPVETPSKKVFIPPRTVSSPVFASSGKSPSPVVSSSSGIPKPSFFVPKFK